MSYTQIKGIPAAIFPGGAPRLRDPITIELDLSVLSVGISNHGSYDAAELEIGALIKSARLIPKDAA